MRQMKKLCGYPLKTRSFPFFLPAPIKKESRIKRAFSAYYNLYFSTFSTLHSLKTWKNAVGRLSFQHLKWKSGRTAVLFYTLRMYKFTIRNFRILLTGYTIKRLIPFFKDEALLLFCFDAGPSVYWITVFTNFQFCKERL